MWAIFATLLLYIFWKKPLWRWPIGASCILIIGLAFCGIIAGMFTAFFAPMSAASNAVPRNEQGQAVFDNNYIPASATNVSRIEDVASMMYQGQYKVTQGYHGSGDYYAKDFATSCGAILHSPLPGTGVVTYSALDFYSGMATTLTVGGVTYSQNTKLVIEGDAGKVVLLHGEYTVKPGDIVIGGVTVVGTSASIGYSTGCHEHLGWFPSSSWKRTNTELASLDTTGQKSTINKTGSSKTEYTNYVSAHSQNYTDKIIREGLANGQLPSDLSQYDMLISVPDCSRVGQKATVQVSSSLHAAVVFDCSSTLSSIPYSMEILDAANKNGIDPLLLAAVVKSESNFDPNAVSHAGAQGLGQLMPPTAAGCGVTDSFDVVQNLSCAAWLLAHLQDRFPTIELALAGYNAGEGNVGNCMCIPQNGETNIYVPRVLAAYEQYKTSTLDIDYYASEANPGILGSIAIVTFRD